MIAIVNIGPHDDDHAEWRDYEVRINAEVKARFRHKRSDGLATCLRKASEAVSMAEIEAINEIGERLIKAVRT